MGKKKGHRESDDSRRLFLPEAACPVEIQTDAKHEIGKGATALGPLY